MQITEHTYRWNGQLGTRNGGPGGVVWHNMGGLGTADAVHAYHKSLGWLGFAYHFLVTRDGRIIRGRPEWAMGGHTKSYGSWIGVCAEGNYETHDDMPIAQLAALKWLHSYLHVKYKGINDRRHKDMPGNSTGCPGKYFPFESVCRLQPHIEKTVLTGEDVKIPRQQRPNRAGWWNFGLLPYIERLRAQKQDARVKTTGMDYVVIPVPKEKPKWWDEMIAWKKKA